jgi:hypothetical protein
VNTDVRAPISFKFPCHRLDELGTYFGLSKTKTSKLETAQVGAASWSKFLNTRLIAGSRLYIAINDTMDEKTGFEILPCDWSNFVQALNPQIWELLTHLKPHRITPAEQMRLRYTPIVAQVALIASLPFARFHSDYSERKMVYMEFPKLDLLDDKGKQELDVSNEVFEPLFSAYDETPAYIQAVNYKGLINDAS